MNITEVREELRHQKLSFTEIAKTVGEKWQVLTPEGKEPFEREAISAKENYATSMVVYKKTEHYREYSRYLADFKAKNAPPSMGTALSSRSSLSPRLLTIIRWRGKTSEARDRG